MKLITFDAGKQSLRNNVLSYVEKVLMVLFSRFLALITDGLVIDKSVFSGDTLLHDVCSILDTRNWILLEGLIANFKNV